MKIRNHRSTILASALALGVLSVGAYASAHGEGHECNCARNQAHADHGTTNAASGSSSNGSVSGGSGRTSVVQLEEDRKQRATVRKNEVARFEFTLARDENVDIEVDFERDGAYLCELYSGSELVAHRSVRSDDDCEFDIDLRAGTYQIHVTGEPNRGNSARFEIEYDIDND